jgi:hypothetical protein
MKPIKLFAILFLLTATSILAIAQNLSEDFSIKQMEQILNSNTATSHRDFLEKRGFIYVRTVTAGNFMEYNKGNDLTLKVYEAGNRIMKISISTSPSKFAQAIREMEANNPYTKLTENSDATFYKKGSYNFGAHRLSSTISMSMTNVTLGTVDTPYLIHANSTAKEVATALNAKMSEAHLGNYFTKYTFERNGFFNMEYSFAFFTAKNNELYIQLHIPKNGDCDYGMKEFKARWTSHSGKRANDYYLLFDYNYNCKGIDYKGLFLYFYPREIPQVLVTDWLTKNGNK